MTVNRPRVPTGQRKPSQQGLFPIAPVPNPRPMLPPVTQILRPGAPVATGTPNEFRGRWAPNGAPNIAPRYDNGMVQQPANVASIPASLAHLLQHPQGAQIFHQFVTMFQNHQAEAARRRTPAWGSRV